MDTTLDLPLKSRIAELIMTLLLYMVVFQIYFTTYSCQGQLLNYHKHCFHTENPAFTLYKHKFS